MISLIIPCYNEAERIQSSLTEVEEFSQKNPGLVDDVVIVDDCSYDNTLERISFFSKKLPLQIHSLKVNSGKWAAIRKGIYHAKNDVVLLLDADFSASVFELEEFGVDRLKFVKGSSVRGSSLAVFGSRFMDGAKVDGKSPYRTVVSKVYRRFVKFCYYLVMGDDGKFIDDFQCPFKLFNRKAIMGKMFTDRFAGDLELSCRLCADIVSIPVDFVHKRSSNVKVGTVFDMFFDSIRIVRKLRSEKKRWYGDGDGDWNMESVL